MSDSPTAWMIRAGRHGEFEDKFLEKDLAGACFREVPDLTGAASRDAAKQMVRNAYPGAKDRTVANRAGQMWSLRWGVKPGDLVVLPLKSKPQIALGVVSGGYVYRGDEDHELRHCVAVVWKRQDVPRTALRQDLLDSLGSRMTVCQIKRNDAVWRLQRILDTGIDPGVRGGVVEAVGGDDPDAADDVDTSFDIERRGRDQIQQHLAERFDGHRLADLVAAVLDAEGFFTEVSPPGPDGGIDIFAGRGPLGLDPPKLIVQVKSSPEPVPATAVRELHGVLRTRADRL